MDLYGSIFAQQGAFDAAEEKEICGHEGTPAAWMSWTEFADSSWGCRWSIGRSKPLKQNSKAPGGVPRSFRLATLDVTGSHWAVRLGHRPT